MNFPSRALIRGAIVVGLGLAAGCFAFHSDAAPSSPSLGLAAMNAPAKPRPLAFVNGKLAHPTRIEEGVGAPAFMPRDTNGAFESVSIEMDAQVVVKVGSGYDVQVSTERNLQKYVQAVRMGPSLLISTTGSYATHYPVKVVITVPALKELDLTGNGKAEFTGNFGRALDVSAEGGWTLSGAGSVDALALTLSDTSSAALSGFKAHDLTLHGGTSGATSVFASGALNGELTGLAALSVYGHPAHRNIKLGHGAPRYVG
jgi:hypothetical protein